MIARHQALIVFIDCVASLLMLAITLLALSGAFNRTVVVNSCPTAAKVVEPAASASASPTASASAKVASPSAVKKFIPLAK